MGVLPEVTKVGPTHMSVARLSSSLPPAPPQRAYTHAHYPKTAHPNIALLSLCRLSSPKRIDVGYIGRMVRTQSGEPERGGKI